MATLRVAVDGGPLGGARTGVGAFCAGLLEGLVEIVGSGEEDLDVGVYAVTWRTRHLLTAALPEGTRLVGWPMPARPLHRAWRLGLPVALELFTGPLDVVHGVNYVVPPTRRAARIVSVHDLTPLRFPEMCEPATLAYPDLIRRAIRSGAWVQTASEFVRAEVVEAFGADPDRVRAVPYGVPALGSSGNRPVVPFERYILAIGTVEPRKDYPGLIRAFDLIAGDRPGLGLVIAGRDGWGSEAFTAALADSPHRDRVLRPGYLPDGDLGALLKGAAVLAYPSRYEGFGFPPLQAMAAGVPVVATAAGSVPEVVGDGALLVPVGDAAALAGALARVLDDGDVASGLVESGRRRAGTFTWRRCALEVAAIYRDAAPRALQQA